MTDLASLRRRLRLPRTLSITRTGRTYLVVTLGVGIGALNTGNNLLYLVLGFLLSMIVVSGILSERCLKGLRIRRLGSDAAFAGEPFPFRYAITKKRGQAFALTVSEVGGELEGASRVSHVRAGTEVIARADLVARRRGPLKLTGIRVTTTFPLGLFAKSCVLDVEDTLLVYPRRGFVCHTPEEHGSGLAGDDGKARRRDGTGDLLGLRELAHGEDARRVHWVKSAAVGKLLRTEREREERRQYTLRVDASGDAAAVDRRCEETAAQARRLLDMGHEVGLVAPFTRIRPASGPGHERRILQALAWVGFDGPVAPRGEEKKEGLFSRPSAAPVTSPSGGSALRQRMRDLAAGAAFASMAVSGSVPIWATATFLLALGLALLGRRVLAHRGGWAMAVLAIAAASLFLLTLRGLMDPVIAACAFAALLTSYRLVSAPTSAADNQVHLTSLLMIAGGAALSGELLFGVFLVVFAVLASLSMGLSVLESASPADEPVPVRPLMRQLSFGTALAVLGGVAFFVVFPRLSWNFAARRPSPGLGATAGFTDRVRLGGDGSIKTNPRVVARITLRDDPGADRLDAYWIGRTFDRFDGREWSGTGTPKRQSDIVHLAPGARRPIYQRIELLPAYSARTLIALDPPLSLGNAVAQMQAGTARAPLVEVSGEEVHFGVEALSYWYHAYSARPDEASFRDARIDPARYMGLPPSLDPRVGELARSIAGAESDPLAAAERLRDHLKASFRYTLELPGEVEDPLSDFLFRRREGHCEHFATALAVMLRTLGHPSRVAAGFYGGERIGTSPEGTQYVLRAGDAHAWTQVFVPGRGWVSVDATPELFRGGQPNRVLEALLMLYERLDAWWRTLVIDYSFRDQVGLAKALVRPPRSVAGAGSRVPEPRAWLWAAAVGLTVYVVWRWTMLHRSRPKPHPASGLLDDIERALSAAGVSPAEGEGIEELASRLFRTAHPLAPVVGRVARRYLEARFGGRPLQPGEKEALVASIRRAA